MKKPTTVRAEFTLDDVKPYLPRAAVIIVVAIVSIVMFSLDSGATPTETSVMGGADGAIVICRLIGWGGTIFVLMMLRNFVVTALTLAFRDYLQNATPKSIALLTQSLYVKGMVTEELLRQIEQLAKPAAASKRGRSEESTTP